MGKLEIFGMRWATETDACADLGIPNGNISKAIATRSDDLIEDIRLAAMREKARRTAAAWAVKNTRRSDDKFVDIAKPDPKISSDELALFERIISAVLLGERHITRGDIIGQNREPYIVSARHRIWALLWVSGMSMRKIAHLSGRDLSTVRRVLSKKMRGQSLAFRVGVK